jgi:hypothetical protein
VTVFVRTKKTASGTVVHLLVENRREGGKRRQKVLYYLGRSATPQDRLDELGRTARFYRAEAEELRGSQARRERRAFRRLSALAADCERRRRRLLGVLRELAADGKKARPKKAARPRRRNGKGERR